jgi:Putative adipose-regulatory protein (Seipin)
MLELSLMSPPSAPDQHLAVPSVLAPSNTSTLLAHSRRPAILPYQSPITSLTHTFLSLPFHTLSLRDIDATVLSIPMFEQVIFARGWRNVPASARLEIQTQRLTQAALPSQSSTNAQQHVALQVYSATIEFHARFRGLRWLMYNWRILSFLAFTSAFYCAALLSTAVAWGVIALISPSSTVGKKEGEEEERRKIKYEENLDLKTTNGHATRPIKREPTAEDGGEESGEESALSLSNLSDNATIFPTLGRQMPLRYPIQPSFQYGSTSATGSTSASGSRRIKKEGVDDDGVAKIEGTTAIEPLAAAATTAGEFAEDEDEEDEEMDRGRDRDSGIGTSMEESAREAVGLQRRRGGRGGSSGSGIKR